jgi:hypothetical protein
MFPSNGSISFDSTVSALAEKEVPVDYYYYIYQAVFADLCESTACIFSEVVSSDCCVKALTHG